MSAELEELQESVEELSKRELDNLELLQDIAELVKKTDIQTINEMPLLYRLEIKKALEKLDKETEASKIIT